MMEEYKRIRNFLQTKREELAEIQKRREHAAKNAREQAGEGCQQLKNEHDRIKTRIARVNAYLVMAESKKCEHTEPTTGKEFNNTAMAQLATQLNGVNGRACASALYTEARAQYITLSREACLLEQRMQENTGQSELDSNMKKAFDRELLALRDSVNAYLHSDEFAEFRENSACLMKIFSGKERPALQRNDMAIGVIPLNIFTAGAGEDIFADWSRADFSGGEALAVPVSFDMTKGQGFLVEFEPANEEYVIGGLQNVLYNFLLHRKFAVKQILMVDPVRNNDTALGALSEICGLPGSPVLPVPREPAQIRQAVGSFLETVKEEEAHRANNYRDREFADRLVVFHDFPVGYDSEQIRWIQEICVSARHYGIVVFVTFNRTAETNKMVHEAVNMIRGYAFSIYSDEHRFFIKDTEQTEFCWFAAPPSLTPEEKKLFWKKQEKTIIDNRFENIIDINSVPRYQKGKRTLKDIPYGIDEEGVLQTLDFEDSNFAYYICGASRSGKSTLLHTIISSILTSVHPDDVEIWLIDFKKTEFSRYIDHLPPHVRYIILDESPELVYDIINRLTEILQKRQTLFMGKWEKLSQVPESVYMPEIFVVIDEFSRMSQILSDSTLGLSGDYAVKLQNLLTAGAAFGFKFIFSSQDFSEGTRGLTATAKKQVQQRIAMYSKDISEIKETLGLKSTSEGDSKMIENLEVHQTLMRIPENQNGIHLKLAKPLYFAEKEIEVEFIDKISNAVHPVTKYYAEDADGYIFKRPLIVDGNSYQYFSDKREELQKAIASQREDEIFVSFGEPRKMVSVYLAEILDSYGENILMIAPVNEAECAASIVCTVDESLKMQGKSTHLWAYRKSGVYKKSKAAGHMFDKESDTLEDVCREISLLREKIEKKEAGNHFYFLMGIDSYLADMEYLSNNKAGGIKTSAVKPVTNKGSDLVFEARKDGEMDLMSKLRLANVNIDDILYKENTNAHRNAASPFHSGQESVPLSESSEYDAREDFKYVLTHGPRHGYHFFVVFNSLQEVKQSRLKADDFKHKILFRTSKTEASEIMNLANAGIVQALEEHAFRYSNGIEALNFRPYIHDGLSFSGTGGAEGEAEEEYLM